ncbi:MAG: flagellar filament capping protein FliD [Treponema sp.]
MNVPGIGAGKYDNLIETLMKKERVPRDKAAEDLKKYEQQNTIWRKLSQFSAQVRDKTRELYSFNNPFVEKTVESSNERALTATASRDAREQSFKISIEQIAKADSFLSKELSKDFQVPKGVYTFSVGEKRLSLNWQGGKYRNFINAVNKKGKNIIQISEIKTSGTANALVFEAQVSGAANRLVFADDALPFALENGLIKENDGAAVELAKTAAAVPAQTTEQIDFSQTVRGAQEYVLEYTVALGEGSVLAGDNSSAIQDTEAVYEQIGAVSFKGVTVTNALSDSGIAPEAAGISAAGAAIEDYNVLSLVSARGTLIPLPVLKNTGERQVFTIPLSEYGDIKALAIHNNNTEKTVAIEEIRVYDPKATGDYIPVNPVSQAQDAVFRFEGIRVTRDKNTVDDVIPGVTLQLEDTTEKPETVSIKPDTETAKNAVIEFVASYNRLLAEINIVTSNQQAVIDEIGYFTDDERKSAEENLGALFGDTTLSSFKSKLRQIVSGVYRKNDDTDIRSLAQMGISTKSDTSTGYNDARLRGYLEIDEKTLDEALKHSMEDVRFLFGYDTNNDILVDDGVAFQFFTQIDPYVQRGGIFSTRTNGLTAQIKTNKEKIDRYDKELEKKEQILKQKYGAMDGSLRKLQKQSDMIDNFKKQNQNSSGN